MKKITTIKILMFFSISISGFGQLDFQGRQLVTLPGENSNIQISSNYFASESQIYICWENRNDTNGFSIYRMPIWPDQGAPELIASSPDSLLHPDVNFEGDVVWQEKTGNNWVLKYHTEETGGVQTLTDTLVNSTQPALSNSILVYIQGLALHYRNLYNGEAGIIDTGLIAHPDLDPEAHSSFWSVTYEKQHEDTISIFVADKWVGQSSPVIDRRSSEKINLNPRFGTMGGIVYQTWIDDAWDIIIENWSLPNIVHGTRPALLMVPIPVVRVVNEWQVFYEQSGVDGDEEIYASGYPLTNEPVNISDLPGIDENPHCSLLHLDSVAVLWEHVTLEGREIWWAKDKLHIQGGAVQKEPNLPSRFQIQKAYPTPFNGQVNVDYRVEIQAEITVSIMNLVGQEISRTHFKRSPGSYRYTWDGLQMDRSRAESGVYIVILSDGSFNQTQKILLLK